GRNGPLEGVAAQFNTDGTLDGGFGVGGLASYGTGNGQAIALGAGGKVLVAGFDGQGLGITIARFNSTGLLDTSFGSGGTTTTPILDRYVALARYGATTPPLVVVVNNVAPTVAIAAGSDSSGVNGQTRHINLTSTDPSSIDQAASFTYTVNWGDGSPVET